MGFVDLLAEHLGQGVVVGGSTVAIWAILRGFNEFQLDFANRYRVELTKEINRRRRAEAENWSLRSWAAQMERDLTLAGLTVPTYAPPPPMEDIPADPLPEVDH